MRHALFCLGLSFLVFMAVPLPVLGDEPVGGLSRFLFSPPPEGFERVLQSDIDAKLDPQGRRVGRQPEDSPADLRPKGPTVPIKTVTTTGNLRYCFVSGATAIDDEMFRGKVGYGSFWDFIVGVNVNLDINIVPVFTIFITSGFEYLLSSGEHDYGEPGTGTEGKWMFGDCFVIPVIAGLKVNIPFLESPSDWFDRMRAMASGPQVRIRAGAGMNFIDKGEITVDGGSKGRTEPYKFWGRWSSEFTFFAGIGFEYKFSEQFTMFFEFAIQFCAAPDAKGDMSTILKNPGDLDPEDFWLFPLNLGITYGF